MAYPQSILVIDDALRSQVPTQTTQQTILNELVAVETELGVDASGGFADVADRLNNNDDVVQAMVLSILANLRVIPNATTPNDICDITCDAIAVGNATVGHSVIQNITGLSCNAGSQGLNGRTNASRTTSAFYYLYILVNPTTGAVGCCWDTNPTTPTLTHASFSGYTRYRRIGARQNNGSGQFWRAYTYDRWTLYDITETDSIIATANGVAPNTTPQVISLTGIVPSPSRLVRVHGRIVNPSLDQSLLARPNEGGSLTLRVPVLAACNAGQRGRGTADIPTDSSRQIQWSTGAAGTGQIYISVWGYHDPI